MNFTRPIISLFKKEYGWVTNALNVIERNGFLRTNIVLRESDMLMRSNHDPKMIKAVIMSDPKVQEDNHTDDTLDWTFKTSRYVLLTNSRIELCEENGNPSKVYKKSFWTFC